LRQKIVSFFQFVILFFSGGKGRSIKMLTVEVLYIVKSEVSLGLHHQSNKCGQKIEHSKRR
jgi:hypothetical protein